jgi:hypothetical protein
LGAGKPLCWAGTTPVLDAIPRPKESLGSFQPTGLLPVVCPERPGLRSKQIEKDGDSSEERKNYPLHSRSCHVFTRDPHMKCFLKDLPQPGQRKSPRKKLQIGRERPYFFGFQPPKKFSGSLPPVAALWCAGVFAKREAASPIAVRASGSREVDFTPSLHPCNFTG